MIELLRLSPPSSREGRLEWSSLYICAVMFRFLIAPLKEVVGCEPLCRIGGSSFLTWLMRSPNSVLLSSWPPAAPLLLSATKELLSDVSSSGNLLLSCFTANCCVELCAMGTEVFRWLAPRALISWI